MFSYRIEPSWHISVLSLGRYSNFSATSDGRSTLAKNRVMFSCIRPRHLNCQPLLYVDYQISRAKPASGRNPVTEGPRQQDFTPDTTHKEVFVHWRL